MRIHQALKEWTEVNLYKEDIDLLLAAVGYALHDMETSVPEDFPVSIQKLKKMRQELKDAMPLRYRKDEE